MIKVTKKSIKQKTVKYNLVEALNHRISFSNLCVDGNAFVQIASDEFGSNTSKMTFFELAEAFKSGLGHDIWTKSNKNGVDVWRQLTGLHGKGLVSTLIEIESEGRTVRVTPEHEIYTVNRGWVMAKDLLESDVLQLS